MYKGITNLIQDAFKQFVSYYYTHISRIYNNTTTPYDPFPPYWSTGEEWSWVNQAIIAQIMLDALMRYRVKSIEEV